MGRARGNTHPAAAADFAAVMGSRRGLPAAHSAQRDEQAAAAAAAFDDARSAFGPNRALVHALLDAAGAVKPEQLRRYGARSNHDRVDDFVIDRVRHAVEAAGRTEQAHAAEDAAGAIVTEKLTRPGGTIHAEAVPCSWMLRDAALAVCVRGLISELDYLTLVKAVPKFLRAAVPPPGR